MHDCRTTESKLVDLVFGELNENERLRLLAEVKTCADCLGDYNSMTGALDAFDRAAEATAPAESFWPAHHAALFRRLDERDEKAAATRRASAWRRLLAMRLPIPVPLAAVILLALLLTSALALRPAARAETALAQPQATPLVMPLPPRVVEVPVYRERVLTRTVYVEKKASERNDLRRKPAAVGRAEAQLAARNNEAESAQGGFFTRANLTDFQPSDEMKIRIVKRNNPDEN